MERRDSWEKLEKLSCLEKEYFDLLRFSALLACTDSPSKISGSIGSWDREKLLNTSLNRTSTDFIFFFENEFYNFVPTRHLIGRGGLEFRQYGVLMKYGEVDIDEVELVHSQDKVEDDPALFLAFNVLNGQEAFDRYN